MDLYKYNVGVESSSDLVRRLPGLTIGKLHNYRRLEYIHSFERSGGRLLFTDRNAYLLENAVPRIEEGIKLRVAFKEAADKFETAAQLVTSAVADQYDLHGIPPTRGAVEKELRADLPEVTRIISALIEDRRLAESQGRLVSMSVAQPVGMLSASANAVSSFPSLSEERKLELRALALSRYLTKTEALPLAERLPAPLPAFQQEGITVTHSNVPRGVHAFSDPETRTITVSSREFGLQHKENDRNYRSVVMHEYFHLELGHTRAGLRWWDHDHAEMEATYAAVHYLVPMHSIQAVWAQLSSRLFARQSATEALAVAYQVSVDFAAWALAEAGFNTREIQRRSHGR